jgi:hypothetical protein
MASSSIDSAALMKEIMLSMKSMKSILKVRCNVGEDVGKVNEW